MNIRKFIAHRAGEVWDWARAHPFMAALLGVAALIVLDWFF